MSTQNKNIIYVVGLNLDGIAGLSEQAGEIIEQATEIWGSERQCKLLPPKYKKQLRVWDAPFTKSFKLFIEHAKQAIANSNNRIVVLASGDPLYYGIASSIIGHLGDDVISVIPNVSSITMACSLLGWSQNETSVVSACGRSMNEVLQSLSDTSGNMLVLCAQPNYPKTVINQIRENNNDTDIEFYRVLINLGGSDQRVEELTKHGALNYHNNEDDLAILAIKRSRDNIQVSQISTSSRNNRTIYNFDFISDGQITRSELRAIAINKLAPQAGELLVDVGAGSGSIACQWLLQCPEAFAVAIEAKQTRVENIIANQSKLGLKNLSIKHGIAPEVLDDVAKPDAVFIGGGLGSPKLLEKTMSIIRDSKNPRILAHAVTLESEAILIGANKIYGGSLTRIEIAYSERIGNFNALRPAMAVTQWFWQK